MISDRIPRTLRFARALLCLASLFAALNILDVTPAASQTGKVVDFIELEGVIDPAAARFLVRQIDRAGNEGTYFLVVRLDTPGGLDISMREIVQKVLGSRIPIVVWVAPSGARAASAGVFITYASHIAVMAPGTNIGAAHPVDLGGGTDEVSAEKAVNDAAAYIRAIALQRGRNPDWAERAVRESVSVDAGAAVDQGIVDFVAGANSIYDQLHERRVEVDGRDFVFDTRGIEVRFYKMSLLERILHTTARPEIAYLLLLLGFYGLIFELYHPGIGASGVLGGVSLIFGFYSLSILPTSWAGVALIVLAVAFFLVDLHTAGLGVWTVGGTVALIAGSLVLFAGADPELRLGWGVIAGAVVSNFVFFLMVMTAAIRARMSRPVSGAEGMIGMLGVARTDISPQGQVHARGTLWRARTTAAAIEEGAQVRIKEVYGLVLVVEPVAETQAADPVDT